MGSCSGSWLLSVAAFLLALPCSGLLAARRAHTRRPTALALGRIALVGAGPGDPELLTVAAMRAISDAKALVVADRLVSQEVLDLVAGELRVAGKFPGCAEAAQQQIYDWVEEAVLADRDVVRLKIGDPFVFGRGGEEMLEFRQRLGVEPRLVPGVSSCLAAPLAAGVPVTHRGAAHQLVVSTGHGKDDSKPELPAYHDYQTVVLLMGVGRLRSLTETLRAEKNFPSDCPAMVVECASRPDQRAIIGDMSDIADLAEEHALKPPSTIVFGKAVRALHTDAPHGILEFRASHSDPRGPDDAIIAQLMTLNSKNQILPYARARSVVTAANATIA